MVHAVRHAISAYVMLLDNFVTIKHFKEAIAKLLIYGFSLSPKSTNNNQDILVTKVHQQKIVKTVLQKVTDTV